MTPNATGHRWSPLSTPQKFPESTHSVRMFGVAEYAFPVDLSNWIENCRVKTRGFKTRGSPDLLRNILVATDVAARGLDLKHVSVVVSYNPAVPALQNSERSGLLEPKKQLRVSTLNFSGAL